MTLSEKEKELVAIGASIGGNCIPCLNFHYAKCIKLGFSNEDMRLAFGVAKMVKEVPNKKIYETANGLVGGEPTEVEQERGCSDADTGNKSSCCQDG